MNFMSDELILNKLDELISLGDAIGVKLVSYSNMKTGNENRRFYQTCVKWKLSALNLLRLKFGQDSVYYQNLHDEINKKKQFQKPVWGRVENFHMPRIIAYDEIEAGDYYQENVQRATGVLKYIQDALKNGLTDDLYYQKEILVLSDLL